MIIDISKWNGTIDWAKVKPCVDFVILRASCGTGKDTMLDTYAPECQRLGIPFGVYHFCENIPAASNVQAFYNAAKKYSPLFWVLDIEDPAVLYTNGKSLPMRPDFYSNVKKHVSLLREKVGDEAKIVYYGGASVFEPYGKLSKIPWDGLWFANYSAKTTPSYTLDGKRTYCDLWQYSSKGKVDGISGRVDCNRIPDEGSHPLAWWLGQDAPNTAEADADTNGDGKIVLIGDGTWNIRTNPSTDAGIVGFAKAGERYDWIATAWNGWLLISGNGVTGWISPKAGSVVEK